MAYPGPRLNRTIGAYVYLRQLLVLVVWSPKPSLMSFALVPRRWRIFPGLHRTFLNHPRIFRIHSSSTAHSSDTFFVSASFLYALHRQRILPVLSSVSASLFDALFDRPHIYPLRWRISRPTHSPTSDFLHAFHLCIFPISRPPRPTAHLSVLCQLHPAFAPIDSFRFMHRAPPPTFGA